MFLISGVGETFLEPSYSSSLRQGPSAQSYTHLLRSRYHREEWKDVNLCSLRSSFVQDLVTSEERGPDMSGLEVLLHVVSVMVAEHHLYLTGIYFVSGPSMSYRDSPKMINARPQPD